jgi:excisionase family DNA binding protein
MRIRKSQVLPRPQEVSMTHAVVALRRHQRRVVTRPEESPSAVLTHLALAITRYVRQLRKDEIPVPPMIDELAAFLTQYVRTRQAVTGVNDDLATSQDVPVVRLLITKAEAADQLGVSVRTVERLISAGRLPLVHVEGAARLRVADLQAYVDALDPLDTEQSERANAD